MGINWEGALAGMGKGLQASAGILERKYERDYQERQDAIKYARQMHLQDLAQKNAMNLAETERGWRQEDAKTRREWELESARRERQWGLEDEASRQEGILNTYRSKKNIDAEYAKEPSEYEKQKMALELEKLRSEIGENQAQAMKYKIEALAKDAETNKISKPKFNSSLWDTAVNEAPTTEGWDKLNDGQKMDKRVAMYTHMYNQLPGNSKAMATKPSAIDRISQDIQMAQKGDQKAKARLKEVEKSPDYQALPDFFKTKISGMRSQDYSGNNAINNPQAGGALSEATTAEGKPIWATDDWAYDRAINRINLKKYPKGSGIYNKEIERIYNQIVKDKKGY